MKVIFKKPLIELIIDVVKASIDNNKTIDYIDLNRKEWEELYKTPNVNFFLCNERKDLGIISNYLDVALSYNHIVRVKVVLDERI